MRSRTIVPVIAAVALIAVPAASAHVTISPEQVPADSFARLTIRVPNEQESADTVKLSVQIPQDVVSISFQPKPGWKRTVTTEELNPPIKIEDETVSERVATVTWSGGKIAPGEFDEFGVSAKMPAGAGKTLIFPAVQTYSNGQVVRWIAPQTAEEPAPHVTLTAAEPEAEAASATSTDEDSEDGRDTLTLVLAIAGLAAGVVALGLGLARWRRA